MEYFFRLMELVFNFMKTPINIWGFEITYFNIMIYVIVAGIIGYFIREVFD